MNLNDQSIVDKANEVGKTLTGDFEQVRQIIEDALAQSHRHQDKTALLEREASKAALANGDRK